jgi:hypothetical protein
LRSMNSVSSLSKTRSRLDFDPVQPHAVSLRA